MAIDFKDYTEKDNEAIERKMEKPAETVLCPRCGKPLKYYSTGNSCAVECPTEGCIHGCIRGL